MIVIAQTMIVFRQYSDDETLAKRHLTDRVDVNRYVVGLQIHM